ncbi:tetratricopeptide repeat protein [Puniceicoccales bacterium CK1056]|uniref:Tetratricopeptide repeat protein n=1 Tax=Oceanipulchritudo coccoides TaxID=2706888 RepID=A0A6B2M191_9BACT|nr:tetratricopeptide repeat protein [Oceanipulchritudo coccoides]NDV62136.1 tetratricopeptide repeat protein [Oceanipulchritudo coccoides]
MKNLKFSLICLLGTLPFGLSAQQMVLTEVWNDPGFVKSFAGSFLPLTDQEPKITEKEADLFKELADLLAINQSVQATEKLASAVRSAADPSTVSAALNYTLANLYLQNGRYAEASGQYQEAIRKFPNFRRAYKNLGLALIQNGSYGEAIKALVKSIEMGDGTGETFGLLAFSYLNEGNPAAALEGYRQASLLNPDNREWRIGKAEALMRTERYAEAIAEFKQLIAELPDRFAFYTSIANAYLSLNEAETAGYYLEVLRRRKEAKPAALGLLGDIYVNGGLANLALTAYQDALKSGGFTINKSIRALKAFLQRGFYAEAKVFLAEMEAVHSANLSDEESREVLNLKAQLALAEGENEEAAAILEDVLDQDPLNGNALSLLGDYNQSIGDDESAIYYYERAVQLPDFQREAQLQLARIYVRQKEYAMAIRQLEGALAMEYSANVQDFLNAVKAVYNRAL